MKSLTASKQVTICGNGDAWKVAESDDPASLTQLRTVQLEIRGDPRNGFHLIKSPSGCFTADDWFETESAALDAAREIYGAMPSDWRPGDDMHST